MKSMIITAAALLLFASAGSALAQVRDGNAGGNAPGSECSDIIPNLPWHLVPRKCQIEFGRLSIGKTSDETAATVIMGTPPPEPTYVPPPESGSSGY
jgi:hypothetical protein